VPNFPIPRALKRKVIKMLNNRIKRNILKKSENPYRNPWFLAKKKDKISYRLINAVMKINRVIIKNTNMPPSVNKFAKKFFKCAITSLINFFFKYDQIELNFLNRDITAFMTPLRLFKMTTLS
jgi:hypothetical protein